MGDVGSLPPHSGISCDISDEQADVLDAISRGENVIVTALPGCGKSKLIEEIICAFPERNIITISYNSKLVEASNERVQSVLKAAGKSDVPVCIKTFHALLSSLVKHVIQNDLLFSEALQCMNFVVLGWRWIYREFDIIIVDEAQDLRLPYVRFIIKLILQVCSNPSKLQLVLLGDEKQELYGFYPINKADARYLTLAEELFSILFPERKWYHARLTISYRTTSQIATFVNALVPSRHMIAGNIKNTNITNWVTLFIADVYRDTAQIVYDIVKNGGVENYGNIMIICSSLNEKSPVMRIVDLLVANGIHVHVKRSGALADGVRGETGLLGGHDDMFNKVCCETCHGCKGRQAPDIIFLNTSELLGEEFVTNPKYVALTRATRRLFIIQHAFYTSQNQIDILIANPDLKQRHLRIVQMRPIAQALKPKQAKETKKDSLYYSKNALSAKTLFAFLDLAHLECLVEHVSYEIVNAGLALQERQDGDVFETQQDEDQQYTAACANYVLDMTLTFNDSLTHVNVTNICSLALQLMLEFSFALRTPSFIQQILQKIGNDMDPKFATMRNIIHDAMDVLQSNQARDEILQIGIVDFVCKNAPCFGKLGIVHDAFHGFRENLYAITNCDFCNHPEVQMRFLGLYESIQTILTDHSLVAHDLIWHKERTGRFIQDSEPVQIKACPAITTKIGNTVIYFTNNATTSHDDRFTAIVNAIVVSNGDELLQNTALYVINVFDASTQRVHLLSEEKVPSAQSVIKAEVEEKRCRNEDEKRTACKRSRSPPFFVEKNTNEKKSNNDHERRIPCDFLSAAIAFKTWCDDDDGDTANDAEAAREEKQQFITKVHAEIAQIQRESCPRDICKKELETTLTNYSNVQLQVSHQNNEDEFEYDD